MDSDNEIPPSISTIRPQTSHSGRRSLPPANALGPHHVLPSYPSSTLQYYCPSPQNAANYAHISSHSQSSHSQAHPPVAGTFEHIPLPSASQSHIPSLRRTPSFENNIDVPYVSCPSFPNQRNSINSHNSQRIHSLSSPVFAQRQSVPHFAAPQPTYLPANPIHHMHPPLLRPQIVPTTLHNPNPTSSFNSSLPSTKDVPLLSGKHDWGPWHSSVRTLILNANLLGHIADDPLPGAIFDPGLWPTYPPVVHRRSTHTEIQSFTEWWSRDGLASHILTSRLSPSVLGSLPIANERMGQRRSARTVYLTLRHQYGAGDYSAVMVIEARLRQLKCLPARGGVRVQDFITTWRISINQMEAAGFLPGIRQLLAIFADGLPNNTVAFINLYDNIISSLNEPNEQLLPNIHQLFDRTIHIENNIQRNRILNPSTRRPQSLTPSAQSSIQPVASVTTGPSNGAPQNTRTT
jgi:hypothetical protein